jgi:ABC-type lipoprotein export system ATPase subunit
MISLQGVSKVYQIDKATPVTAVHDINLAVAPGEFVTITGRSGSGKTTVLNLIAGLTRPTSGQVLFEGENLWQLPDGKQSLLRNQRMGFVFQFPSLLPSLTTLENVVLPTAFGTGNGKDGAGDRAAELLDLVGLSDKAKAYPRQLSAGQQQRVVVARALINSPDVLLADEPTSNLDEQTEQEIMALLQSIHGTTGVTVVMVTHTTQLVRFGTRALAMSNGAFTDGLPAGQAPAGGATTGG